jgi:CBS domain-containing protein
VAVDLRDLAREAVVCLPTSTVAEVTDLMAREGGDVAVVVDLDLRPRGLVTVAKVSAAATDHDHGPDAPVGPMARDAVSIVCRCSTRDAASHMQAWSTRRLVVVDENRQVVGILHAEDVATAIEREDEFLAGAADSRAWRRTGTSVR